jgi:hypothetical protein
MIHGSVTASCNYASETFLDGTPRERFRFASVRGDTDGPASDNRFDSLLPVSNSFEISRGWIENDNYVSHRKRIYNLSIHLPPIVMLSVAKHLWLNSGLGD